MNPRYKITVSYDGTAYSGWQVQPRNRTVQQEIEKALNQITGEKIRVHGSGRTDKGVHARAQVAHFEMEKNVAVKSLRIGLNALVDDDIRIINLAKTVPDFDARRHASSKEYRYFIWNADLVPPPLRMYRTHVPSPLDVKRMRRAAKQLIGRHDFAAFTANAGRELETTIRHLTELRIVKRGSEIAIVAKANGFLYKMVRSLAGFLVRVGDGSIEPGEAKSILASKNRTCKVATAPPEGLFLWRVTY